MEEEIDLREYINVIIRRWKWIAGVTLVAVITAAIVSFFAMAPIYEASAILLVSPSPPASRGLEAQVVEALLRSAEVEAEVVEALLRNAKVEAQVVETLGEVLSPSEREPGGLLAKIKVAQEGKSGVFKVFARTNEPQKAAQIANAWAEAGAQILREAQSPTDTELEIAAQNLEVAEKALWEFAEANRLTEADLSSLLGSKSGQWSINFFLEEGGVISQRASPSLSVEKRVELARLLRRRDIAEEIYLSLAREAERARITTQAGRGVEIIGPAVAPSEPVQPRTKLNIAIAGVLGLMVGVFGAFVVEYFWPRY